MKLSLKVEDGSTWFEMTLDALDKEALDKQCLKLGLTESTTSTPLGNHIDSPMGFWKDTHTSSLATAIQGEVTRLAENEGLGFYYRDVINSTLAVTDSRARVAVNIGVFRLRPAVGETFRTVVAPHLLTPTEVRTTLKALSIAYQVITSIIFDASVTLTIIPRGA